MANDRIQQSCNLTNCNGQCGICAPISPPISEETALPPLHWGDTGNALAEIRMKHPWAHAVLSGIVDDYLTVRQFVHPTAPPSNTL